MPAKSKQQLKFFKAVESGSIKKKGLSKAQAKEYTQGQTTKGLPNKVKKKATTKKKSTTTRKKK